MNDPYSHLNALWAQYIDGTLVRPVDAIVEFLKQNDVNLRTKDGALCQVTVSKPTLVADTLVVGLRYLKNDKTYTEDLFEVHSGSNVEKHYKGRLERVLPEYRDTHKQTVSPPLVVDLPAGYPTVNTISFLSKNRQHGS
jgi:hypothetical protein